MLHPEHVAQGIGLVDALAAATTVVDFLKRDEIGAEPAQHGCNALEIYDAVHAGRVTHVVGHHAERRGGLPLVSTGREGGGREGPAWSQPQPA